jgi:hypothetical protein
MKITAILIVLHAEEFVHGDIHDINLLRRRTKDMLLVACQLI